tara:strand:- start:6772 stop:6975 length:204 start_codon:yes stop_codon:yes gene_type:complete
VVVSQGCDQRGQENNSSSVCLSAFACDYLTIFGANLIQNPMVTARKQLQQALSGKQIRPVKTGGMNL